MPMDPSELTGPLAAMGGSGGLLFGFMRILEKIGDAKGWFKNGHAAPMDPELRSALTQMTTQMRETALCQERISNTQERLERTMDREVLPALKELSGRVEDVKSEQIEISRSLEGLNRRRGT